MFKPFKKVETFAVPPPETVVVPVTLDRIISLNPVTEKLCAPLSMPPAIVEFLQDAWLSCTEDVNLNGFTVEKESHESCEGLVVLLVKWNGEKIVVGFALYGEETDEPEAIIWAAESLPKGWDAKRLKAMWVRLDPVEPIRHTDKVVLPNVKCHCGSGKKFKKCCGRLIV